MKEFIYRIEDNESDESEVFIGWIRKQGHELIRCRDCKWYEIDKPHYCGFGGHGYRFENDFCSDAVREEE